MREDGLGKGGMGGVDAECKHDDDASGPCGDWKGEGIEGFALEFLDLFRGDGGNGAGGGLFGVWRGVLLVEERPADHGDDDAARDLHDRQGDSEEGEQRGADQLDDTQKDNGVNGDAACEGTVGVDGGQADQPEKDEGGAERVDEREKCAEPQGEEFPEKQHGFTRSLR